MRVVACLLGCCLVLYCLGTRSLAYSTTQVANQKVRPEDRKKQELSSQIDGALRTFIGQNTSAADQEKAREQLISIVQQPLGSPMLLQLIHKESDPALRLSLQIAVANALAGAQTLLDNRQAVRQSLLSVLRIADNDQVAIGLSTGLFNETLDDLWQQSGSVDPEALAQNLFEVIKSGSGARFEKVAQVLVLETSAWMKRKISAEETLFHRTLYSLAKAVAPQEPSASASEQMPPSPPPLPAVEKDTISLLVWLVFLGAFAYLLHYRTQQRQKQKDRWKSAA